ncbi:hypothetical protein [Sphingomonas sp.]|jgi:hypothetical protein|uniref:hypothetical protein n=1 Tax=Sphingomonas sp. TaxID=28214 RepID=UPI003D6D5BDA
MPVTASKIVLPVIALLLVSGCAKKGDIDLSGGVGITAVRSACPTVGIPASTGDITIFDPPASREASAIDVTASMTNVRSTCADATNDIVTSVTFEVRASRVRADAARDVTLPYFITVVRGGSAVVAKRIGRVNLHFDAGQTRASTSGQASSIIARSAATLPDEVKAKLTQKRKAGDSDAAVDPLTAPEIRQAVQRATFEALVGFQLTDDQLKYNATR